MNRECERKNNCVLTKRSVLLILLIFLLLGTVIYIMIYTRENHSKNVVDSTVSTVNSRGGVDFIIDPDSENYSANEYDNTEEQGVAISGKASMTISANTNEVEVDFYNPEENAGLYYMTFELRLCNSSDQDYEILYTSDLVEPGKHINQITLSRELEEGKYKAIIHVQPYRMNEEKTLTNNADMKIELIVK